MSKSFSARLVSRALFLATSATIGLGAASAQTAAETTTDEVVVTATPIRDSIERSLEVQREADNVVSVIAADTVGRFPDATAAQALARLPGVATQRDQGQERFIQIRGAPARWTAVAFDGLNVLGADERVFRFDSVPAALVSQLVVNKNLTADQPAEALAGRVDIATYSALANPGLHAQLEAGYGYVDLGDGPNSRLAARVSYGTDTWGVVFGASAYKFEQRTENAEPRFDAVGITEQRNATYIIERETNSLFGKVEFAPNPAHTISLTSLYTEFLDDEERNQWTFYFNPGSGPTRAISATNRSFTGGDIVGAGVQAAYEKGEYKNSTTHTVLHGDHEFGAWEADWDLGYTETLFSQFLPIPIGLIGNPAARPSVQITGGGEGGTYRFTLFDTVQSGTTFTRGAPLPRLEQNVFDTQLIAIFAQQIETEAFALRGALRRDWESFGADATFSFGFQYDDREARDRGNEAFISPTGAAPTSTNVIAGPLNVPAQLGVTYNINNIVTGIPIEYAYDRGYPANYIANGVGNQQFFNLTRAAAAANLFTLRPNPALANTVDETILAGFVQNRWAWDRHTLVAGVRVEQTENESRGVATVGAVQRPISIAREDTLVFPSVHYSYDLTEDMKVRFAFVSGAARPDFVDMRATVSINDALRTVSGGNPELKPEEAIGFDASWEWYFAPGGILSASAFYRDVSDVLFSATRLLDAGEFSPDGVNRAGYTYSTVLNGGDGNLQGIEFTYSHPFTFLPGFWSGFGVQGSIAFLDGEFDGPGGRSSPFPGTSDRVINGSIFYEKYGASIRLSYTDRTDWLDELSPGAATDLFWDDTKRVELSARYQINENFTVFFDGNNLTDEIGRRYIGREDRPYEVEAFGRRFLFGIRASY